MLRIKGRRREGAEDAHEGTGVVRAGANRKNLDYLISRDVGELCATEVGLITICI